MTSSLQGYGQSIWLDFISRKMITNGQLARLVADAGVVGVTSNPTIFEKAIGGSSDYASVDKLLDEKMRRAAGSERERLERLHGKTAIANARLAYQSYKRIFAGPRWEALEAHGARKQRLLWASTSVKNPRYRDVMYVEELIGADTIDTMPVETLTAFRDHGKTRASLDSDLDQARATLEELEAAGVSLRTVTDDLVVDGIKKFQEPYDKMIATLAIR
jgi:transaldolase/glucose-6-phosphate isomerase